MIRFNCPACGRHYELPDALASLPLVCKQCGQRLTPPAPTPDPPPPPPKPVAPPPPVAAPAPKPAEPPKPAPPAPVGPFGAPPNEDDEDVLVAQPDASPDIDFNIGGPTAASLSDATRARSTGLSDAHRRPPDLSGAIGPGGDSIPELNFDLLGPPSAPPAPKPAPPPPEPEPPAEEKPEPTLFPFLADLGTFLLLVIAGLFLGELLADRPMGQVISEAGSAPKFPPLDLLLLLGPPLVFGLIYVLLGGRERTVGAWLRRRRK